VQLLAEDRFPRIWVPSKEEKDLRQLLIHRYKLVRIRAQVKNGLQHLALNQGLQRKKRLWSEAGQKALCELPLAPWASRRREDLLKMQEELDAKIAGGPGQILGVLSRHSRPQAIFLVHRAPGNAEVARSRSVRAGLGFAFSFGSNKFPQLIRISR
jgi:transposase